MRPPQARNEKPKVSAFTSAKIEWILELKPDLVLGFSDLQSEIAASLIKHGVTVLVFNQRSVQEILNMFLMTSALVGAPERGESLVNKLKSDLENIRQRADLFSSKPTVYFEEWDAPMISGIRWVSELIENSGRQRLFSRISLTRQEAYR